MKYFTPKLLLAYGSDDPATWKEAEARWDEACARYDAHMEAVNHRLPPGLRRLEADYLLHDAKVRGMGSREGSFVFVLQLEAPPRPLLTLTYDLTEAPSIDPEALPAALRSSAEEPEWQYDEVEPSPDEGGELAWRQSILLSNGWEVSLQFRDVRVEEHRPLFPLPTGAALGQVGAARTA